MKNIFTHSLISKLDYTLAIVAFIWSGYLYQDNGNWILFFIGGIIGVLAGYFKPAKMLEDKMKIKKN